MTWEFQESQGFSSAAVFDICGCVGGFISSPSFWPWDIVNLYQQQNIVVNHSNRQGINKRERIAEAEMDGEAE